MTSNNIIDIGNKMIKLLKTELLVLRTNAGVSQEDIAEKIRIYRHLVQLKLESEKCDVNQI